MTRDLTVGTTTTLMSDCYDRKPLRVAFLGNSMQFTNDSPRLMEQMFAAANAGASSSCQRVFEQDSCLRSGADISSLWWEGTNVFLFFRHTLDWGADYPEDLLSDSKWDFVVINDNTQWPARADSRAESLRTLELEYVPLLKQNKITPIFLMTPAYKKPCIEGSGDLGDFDYYTHLLADGYINYYKKQMDFWLQTSVGDSRDASANLTSRVAPIGLAYQQLRRSNMNLWEKLYDHDEYHPSYHGTLLQAYVLYITLTGETPPNNYSPTWWDTSRYDPLLGFDKPLPIPTQQEARQLRQAAIQVMQTDDGTLAVSIDAVPEQPKSPMRIVCP